MEDSSEIVESKKKPARSLCLRRKYIIGAMAIFLCIFAGLIYRAITWEPKPDPESEKIIRQIVAEQLDKDPKKLTDEDFAKIQKLSITLKSLNDIILLEKFTNLKVLRFNYVQYPQSSIPKLMKMLANFGVYDLNKRFSIDLSPLENLTNLEELTINQTTVRDIKPLDGLIKLKYLSLTNTPVSDLKPIKNLPLLQTLDINFCWNIKNKDVQDLKKMHPNLRISGIRILNK